MSPPSILCLAPPSGSQEAVTCPRRPGGGCRKGPQAGLSSARRQLSHRTGRSWDEASTSGQPPCPALKPLTLSYLGCGEEEHSTTARSHFSGLSLPLAQTPLEHHSCCCIICPALDFTFPEGAAISQPPLPLQHLGYSRHSGQHGGTGT